MKRTHSEPSLLEPMEPRLLLSAGHSEATPLAAPPTQATVTVKANKPVTVEGGKKLGQFTLTRKGGDTKQPLALVFSMGGTAANGTDYAAITDLTFPAKKTKLTVNVQPVDDNLVNGDRTAALELQAGTGYAVGVASSATVTIQDNDYSLAEYYPVANGLVWTYAFKATGGPATTATNTITGTSPDFTMELLADGNSLTDYVRVGATDLLWTRSDMNITGLGSNSSVLDTPVPIMPLVFHIDGVYTASGTYHDAGVAGTMTVTTIVSGFKKVKTLLGTFNCLQVKTVSTWTEADWQETDTQTLYLAASAGPVRIDGSLKINDAGDKFSGKYSGLATSIPTLP